MSLSLDGIQSKALQLAGLAIDATSQGLSLAGRVISTGTSWAGRQVVALGPVLQQAATTAANKITRIASVIATIVMRTFFAIISIAQQVYQAAAHFVKTHPRDVKVALAAAVISVTTTLVFQSLFAKKEVSKV